MMVGSGSPSNAGGAVGVGPMRGPGGFSRGGAVGGMQGGMGGGHGYHPYARSQGQRDGGGGQY